MARDLERVAVDIIAAAGGRLVSHIRLQKLAYLLDCLGMNSGFTYVYRNYGPYSNDVDIAIFDAKAFGFINEIHEHRNFDGAIYSVFQMKGDAADHEFSYLRDVRLREIVKRLASTRVTILELATTAHWLVSIEKSKDWTAEIIRRKGAKVSDGRLAEATRLLAELELPPAAATPRQPSPPAAAYLP